MATATVRRPAVPRGALLSPSWPLTVGFAAFPVWWVLGLGAFAWAGLAVPMALHLVLRGQIRLPRGFGLWLLFLAWMLFSALGLGSLTGGIVFGFRASLYLAATVLFIYVYNTPSRTLPTERVVGALVAFWLVIVAGGFLGVLAPDISFHTPAESLLPGGLGQNAYLHDLMHARSAQVQDFLGYPVPRPAAPFVFTNEWGSAFALLLPMVVLAARRRRRGWFVRAALALSVVPVILSVNRGLWLSALLGITYGSIRLLLRGRPGGTASIVLGTAFLAAVVLASPLGQVLEDRLATGHSDKGRLSLATQAIEASEGSPLIGYGIPQASTQRQRGAPIGTHGMLWMLLVSHGIPATAFFVGFLLLMFWKTRGRGTETQLWAHVTIFVALTQLPYYGMLPYQLFVVMTAAALACREAAERRAGAALLPTDR